MEQRESTGNNDKKPQNDNFSIFSDENRTIKQLDISHKKYQPESAKRESINGNRTIWNYIQAHLAIAP